MCAYCGIPLPEDAEPEQRFCKPGHKVAYRRKHNGTPVRDAARIQNALALDSTYADHAASCARKTANGGAYESWTDAMAALRWLRETDGEHEGQSIYRCLVCSLLHITGSARHERRIS